MAFIPFYAYFRIAEGIKEKNFITQELGKFILSFWQTF
jgi:hypothetical protein